MLKALVVEDNEFFRQTIVEIFQARIPGILVEGAEDGVEARAKLERFDPDFVLIDIQLPGENGLALCRAIRELKPKISIAVYTSYDFPEYRKAADQAGADHFAVKGQTSVVELISMVRQAGGLPDPGVEKK